MQNRIISFGKGNHRFSYVTNKAINNLPKTMSLGEVLELISHEKNGKIVMHRVFK